MRRGASGGRAGVGLGRGGVGRTSIACLRSSSTVARVESFSSWVIFAAIIGTCVEGGAGVVSSRRGRKRAGALLLVGGGIIGTLIRRALSVKLALYVKVSVGSTSFPAGSFVKILYLPTHSDITYLEGGGRGGGGG